MNTGGTHHLSRSRSAAFFDLDKTIIAKSSSMAFSKSFLEGGLLTRTKALRTAYAQFLFEVGGADERQTSRLRDALSELVAGWDVALVRAIVADTIHEHIDPIVYREALDLIRRHQANGRDVIIVSASAMEVVEPIAEPDTPPVEEATKEEAQGPDHVPRDASGIELTIPENRRAEIVSFISTLESIQVEPDWRAKVVVNERTGTVVTGGNVRISKVSISHGDLKLSIRNENYASQPSFIGNAGDGVRTAMVTNTFVDVSEQESTGFVTGATTVSDLVQSLTRLKTNTRDIISILRAIKAAGALHADLIIQ